MPRAASTMLAPSAPSCPAVIACHERGLGALAAASSAALLEYPKQLATFVDRARSRTEAAPDPEVNEWPMHCWRRSAIQILLDEHADTAVASTIDLDSVDELDGELRRLGLDAPPVPRDEIPNVPHSHWWWRYPETAAS